MSTLISMRLPDDQTARLEHLARQSGRTVGEVVAQFLDEELRTRTHPYVEFRDFIAGRQAHISGTSFAVWEVVLVACAYPEGERVEQTTRHLRWPVPRVQAALRYAEVFPQEIEAALQDNASYDFARLERELPGVRQLVVPRHDDPTVS